MRRRRIVYIYKVCALHLVSFINLFGTCSQFNFFNRCIEVTYKRRHIFNVCNLIDLDKYPLSFNFTMVLWERCFSSASFRRGKENLKKWIHLPSITHLVRMTSWVLIDGYKLAMLKRIPGFHLGWKWKWKC